MKTELLAPRPDAIEKAAGILRAGGLVAIPTETVYGLAANALDGAAVSAIFAAKGRPQDNPLISHIASMDMLGMVTGRVPPQAQRLAEAFWPGPLTMVLPRGAAVAREVCAGLETAAVRMPSHPVAQAVIRAAGVPLAGAFGPPSRRRRSRRPLLPTFPAAQALQPHRMCWQIWTGACR